MTRFEERAYDHIISARNITELKEQYTTSCDLCRSCGRMAQCKTCIVEPTVKCLYDMFVERLRRNHEGIGPYKDAKLHIPDLG